MTRRVLPVLMSLALATGCLPAATAADAQPDVNFKIYSPPQPDGPDQSAAPPAGQANDSAAQSETADSAPSLDLDNQNKTESTGADTASTTNPAAGAGDTSKAAPSSAAGESTSNKSSASKGASDGDKLATRVLQGYIRVVPSGTKIPIIMDTAVDSDTSQEGDEFTARTAEDLTIDGQTAAPAGSVIKGRIAQLNAPRHLNRSGSVGLKFDSITTPDNRQIPIVANIVARGGVVHARRGLKDIAIDTGCIALPTAAGVGIGVLAGASSSSSSIGSAGGALIGAGIGLAVGTIILLSKKGKKVDVRPGDELKIELAEDLRMPM